MPAVARTPKWNATTRRSQFNQWSRRPQREVRKACLLRQPTLACTEQLAKASATAYSCAHNRMAQRALWSGGSWCMSQRSRRGSALATFVTSTTFPLYSDRSTSLPVVSCQTGTRTSTCRSGLDPKHGGCDLGQCRRGSHRYGTFTVYSNRLAAMADTACEIESSTPGALCRRCGTGDAR